MMNTIHHLDDPAALDPLLAFYAETRQSCWIDLSSACAVHDLAGAMIAAGFRPVMNRSLLFAAVSDLPALPPPERGVEVRQIGRSELDSFLDIMNRGFDTPESLLAALRRNQAFWSDIPSWRLYLGLVDGTPSGAAVLSLHEQEGERIGYLAAGATLDGARRRGLHRALLSARLREATSFGCDLVTGQADFGSISQRNQQRAGLAIGSVITVWSNGD
jgi:GNAT superfamily N-acetyltransferase